MIFRSLKTAAYLLHPDALLLADSGYQGLHKHHQNVTLPVKKKKAKPFRLKTKPIIRRYQNSMFSLSMSIADAKFFRIVKDVYRSKHKHYSLTWNLVAALVNLLYGGI